MILLLSGSAANAGRIDIDRKKEAGVQAELSHNYQQAEIFYRQALAMAEKDAAGSSLIPELLCRICTVSVVEENIPQADLYLNRVLKILPGKGKAAKEDRETLVWLEDMADAYGEYGYKHNDVGAMERCVQIREYVSGEMHPRLAFTYMKAAVTCSRKGGKMLDKADFFARKALAVNEKHCAPNHLELARSHFSLGTISLMRFDYQTCELETKKTLDVCEKSTRTDPALEADAMTQLGSASIALGKFAQAEQVLLAALKRHKQAKDLPNSKVGLDYEELAMLNYRRHNTKKGDEFLNQAMKSWQKASDCGEQVELVIHTTIKKFRTLGMKAPADRLGAFAKKLKS